jgi:hypothetical protein
MTSPRSRARGAAPHHAIRDAIAYADQVMSAVHGSDHMRRFSEDPLFRFVVVLERAAEHMQTELDAGGDQVAGNDVEACDEGIRVSGAGCGDVGPGVIRVGLEA